jgi:NADH dehydrogenase FAD-containing subunit
VTLAVIGGGPAALELACNLWRLVREERGKARIMVLGGKKFLGRFPERLRQMALTSLTSRAMEVVEGAYVTRSDGGVAVLSDGRSFSFDCVLVAMGVKPPQLFQASGLPTDEEGGLSVNQYLQTAAYPEVFGGGDCIGFTPRRLDKVGVYAVRENPVLAHNLLAALGGGSLTPFVPQHSYLLIFNLGDGTGIFYRNNMVWKGRLAFRLKSFIDRQFMRKFQVSGELSEPSPSERFP